MVIKAGQICILFFTIPNKSVKNECLILTELFVLLKEQEIMALKTIDECSQ